MAYIHHANTLGLRCPILGTAHIYLHVPGGPKR